MNDTIMTYVIVGIIIICVVIFAFIYGLYSTKRKYDAIEKTIYNQSKTYKQIIQEYQNNVNELGIEEGKIKKTAKILFDILLRIFKH